MEFAALFQRRSRAESKSMPSSARIHNSWMQWAPASPSPFAIAMSRRLRSSTTASARRGRAAGDACVQSDGLNFSTPHRYRFTPAAFSVDSLSKKPGPEVPPEGADRQWGTVPAFGAEERPPNTAKHSRPRRRGAARYGLWLTPPRWEDRVLTSPSTPEHSPLE